MASSHIPSRTARSIRGRRALALAVAAMVTPAGIALSATRTWDGGGASATWSTAANWSDDTEPTSADAAILPTPIPVGDTTITLSSGEAAQSLTINDNYTLTAGILTIATGSINTASGVTAIFASNLAGSGGLTKSGDGTLSLTGSKSFTNDVSITGGTLEIINNNNLGSASNDIIISNGATFRIADTLTITRNITLGTGGGVIEVLAGESLTLLTGGLETSANAVTFNGAGTVSSNVASARTGTSLIQNGVFRLSHATALGSGAITVNTGGELQVNATINATPVLALGSAGSGGTVRGVQFLLSGGATYSGAITAAASVSTLGLGTGTGVSDSLLVSNYTGGSGSTTHITGSGTVLLPSTTTYAGGWAIDSGTLQVESLNIGQAVALNNGILRSTGTSTISGVITAAGSIATLGLSTGVSASDTLIVNSYAGGSGSTTHVTGSGTVLLPSANTYAGGWELDGGTLRIKSGGALGSGTSPLVINAATLALDFAGVGRAITMNNGAAIKGVIAQTSSVSATITIAPGANVSFAADVTAALSLPGAITGGGGGSSITVPAGSNVFRSSSPASSYVGQWIINGASARVFVQADNQLGDPANPVTIDNEGSLVFDNSTSSSRVITVGNNKGSITVFGTVTLNSGLAGAGGDLWVYGVNGSLVLNAASARTGPTRTAKTSSLGATPVLRVNHNAALGTGGVQVGSVGSIFTGELELGSGITINNPMALEQGVLRGNNNATYSGTIAVETLIDGISDPIALATVNAVDVFTIGDSANDLTSGGAETVITAAGPGKIVLAQSNNVTANWIVSGGILEIGAENRLGNAGSITLNGGTLQLAGASMTAVPLTINAGGSLRATGTSSYTNSPYPKITNALADVSLTAVGASDVLNIGAAIRSVSAAVSSATIHVNGAGRVVLQSGGTSAADIFGGSWEQSGGILQVGQSNPNSINALGFKNGDAKQANTITVNNFSTLAVGIVGSGTATPAWLRANVILSTGKIASTNGIDAQFGGDFVITDGGGFASRVLVYDPLSPATVRNVSLVAGAAGTDNNAAVTTWGGSLVVDPGTTTGGSFNITRTGGTVSVDPGATLILSSGSNVVFSGSADALSDGVDHVHVLTNTSSTFRVTGGGVKHVGEIDGTGKTRVDGNATISATRIRQNVLELASGNATVRQGVGNSGLSRVDTLTLVLASKLDLTSNKLIVNAASVGDWHDGAPGNYDGISGFIKAGYNHGGWNGFGIITSMSDAAAPNLLTTLGVASFEQKLGIAAAQTAVWNGQTVEGNNVLVMYTYNGDANLSGFVDADDYFLIDSNYGTTVNAEKHYHTGDFNYSGTIDADDYFIIDQNFSAQGAPFGPALPVGVSAVPEPAGVAAAVLLLSSHLRRRRAGSRSA